MALAAACAATMALVPATASANGGGSVSPRDPGAKKFVGEITVPKIGEHLTALQRIATLNDDTREVFSPGYQESLDYVVSTLKGPADWFTGDVDVDAVAAPAGRSTFAVALVHFTRGGGVS